VKKQTTTDLVHVCDRCGLLIYAPGTAGHALGNGCMCSRPRPQPDPLPGGPDAVQLALFPPPPPRRALGRR
jgi:hypothetical protein